MNACFPKIRLARWTAGDFRANAFELSAPYVFQILPLRRSRSSFVQVNRNLITLPDLLAHMARHGDAIFEGDSVDGDEWHNVRSSHAGMGSLMLTQIDQLGGLAHATNGGFLDRLPLADEGDDRAIVIRVHFAVEKINAIDLHGMDDGVNSCFVPALREIGDAFHQG